MYCTINALVTAHTGEHTLRTVSAFDEFFQQTGIAT